MLCRLAAAAATIEPVEVEPNASRFAIYAAVRAAVLESDAKLVRILCNSAGGGGLARNARGGESSCCFHCAAACKATQPGAGRVNDCRCHAALGNASGGGGGRATPLLARSKIDGIAAAIGGLDTDNDSSTDEAAGGIGDAASAIAPPMLVPQIVGAGLRSLFELIAEARLVNPMLCTKALRALFDVIQGQVPEAFRAEPGDMMLPLYELLLDLATLQPTAALTSGQQQQQAAAASSSAAAASSTSSSVLNIFSSAHHQHQHQQQLQGATSTAAATTTSTANWSAIGCSALLGLCVARGDTGKTLRAIAALLMSPPALARQKIQLPLVLDTLQRSIVAVALGRPTRPDYWRNGVPLRSLVGEFELCETVGGGAAASNCAATASSSTATTSAAKTTHMTAPKVVAMAAAGKYIYMLTAGRGLLKVGSGYGGSLAGFVYARNDELGRADGGHAWIGMCGRTLYYKRLNKRSPSNDTLHIIDQQTLQMMGTAMANKCPSSGGGLLFSDGEAMFALCSQVAAQPTPSSPATRDAAASVATDALVVKLVHTPAMSASMMGGGVSTTATATAATASMYASSSSSVSAAGAAYTSNELTLKLARKNFRTLGYAVFEEELLSPAQIQKVRFCLSYQFDYIL